MPFLVTAGDITSDIIRIDAAAQGVDAIFKACPNLDAGTQQAWAAWYAGWQKWADVNKDVSNLQFGLPAIGNQAVDYENEVKTWQQKANDVCGSQIPIFATQNDAADQNAQLGSGVDSALSAAKWIAGAVIAALIVPPIVETIKAFHSARQIASKSKSSTQNK